MGDRAGKRGPLLLLLFLLPTIVVINVSHWLVLSRSTRAVEKELGLRLVTVAASAVTTTTPDLLLATDVAEDAFVRRTLQDIADRHELDDVFLLDPSGNLLWDLHGRELGDPSPFLETDFAAFRSAVTGVAACSTLCAKPKTRPCRSSGTTCWRIVCSADSAAGMMHMKTKMPTT